MALPAPSFESQPCSGEALRLCFEHQRAAFAQDRYPSLAQRRDRLQRLSHALAEHSERLIAAVNQDFGHRSVEESRVAEIAATQATIHYLLSHLRGWMRPRRRRTSVWFLPGHGHVAPQPLGVVGVMAPWNYPVNLAIGPLAAGLGAGNRVMIKTSELTPATTAVLRDMLASCFDTSEVAVIDGDAQVAADFARLPFGHLLFTGSTRVGRKVMQAAAENLTSVTLELGGKCPVIIDDDYPIEEAAQRILWGKTFNAGQTCVAPDYVLLPRDRLDAFVAAMLRHFAIRFPDGALGRDYSSIIDAHHYSRLQSLLAESTREGARVVPAEPATPHHAEQRKLPMTMVINPAPESAVMRDEIFGPLLPVLTHDGIDDALARINAGDSPLGLYYFGHSKRNRQQIIEQAPSGGVTVNDVMLQFLQVDLPFGGVGASGFGRYHGREGLDSFSHLKPVFVQRGFGRFTGLKLLYPPYGRIARRLISMMGG